MVWMLQRKNDVLTCEIRQSADASTYEFEVASERGPAQTMRFETPTDLINGYLRWQTVLQAHGWQPRPAA